MKIGELFVALGFDVDDQKLKTFNENMQTGVDVAGKFTLAAAGAAGALGALISNAAKQTVSLQNFNLQTGNAIEGVAKFASVVQKTNPAETFESGLTAAKALNEYLTNASKGGSATELNMLGVLYKPGMNNQDVISQLHETLPEVLKRTDKRIVSQWIQTVFGDAGVIGALNIPGTVYDKIGESGLLDPEKEKSLRQFADSVAKLDTAWQHFEHTIGSEFAPAFTTAMDGLTKLLGKIEEMDQKLPGAAAHAGTFGAGVLAAVTGGTASTVAGKLGFGRVAGLLGGGAGLGAVGALASIPWISSDVGNLIGQHIIDNRAENTKDHAIGFFKALGWSDAQAQGLVARLGKESGLNPRETGDGGNAYGAAQWHPDRQADFEAFAHKDIRESSLDEQLSFIHYELTKGNEQKAGRLLRGTNTPTAAEGIATGYYERPASALQVTMHITGSNAQEIGEEVMRKLETTQNSQALSQRDLGSIY